MQYRLRSLFLLFVIAVRTTGFCAPPFILVHLGPYLPQFYLDAIKQVELFNPESDVYLLVESKVCRLIDKGKYDLTDNLHVVNIDHIPFKEKQYEFRKVIAHLPQYWIYTFDRFFVLERFLKHTGLQDVIHIEGDNLVYANFDLLLPQMKSSKKDMLMAFANDHKAIPGVCYFRNSSGLAKLTNYMLEHYEYDENYPFACNDMKLIADSKLCASLPSVPLGYSKIYPLVSEIGSISTSPANFEGNYEYLGGRSLFDPAPYGQFLDGLSPVHDGYGVSGYINKEAVYTVDSMPIMWVNDEFGRRVPYVFFLGKKYRLNNLHVHSKNLYKFTSW